MQYKNNYNYSTVKELIHLNFDGVSMQHVASYNLLVPMSRDGVRLISLYNGLTNPQSWLDTLMKRLTC